LKHRTRPSPPARQDRPRSHRRANRRRAARSALNR
jgi:hypothetical protein